MYCKQAQNGKEGHERRNPVSARVLVYDLEIAPLLGWAYEVWDATVIKVERPPYIMCFAWKWLDESVVNVCAQPDFESFYADEPHNDYFVALQLHLLLNEADAVIAHNAAKFDNKVAMARFLDHGMKPPSPFKTIDTLQAARRYFRMGNNSLDKLCERLGLGTKTRERHHDLWPACIDGDLEAWEQMKTYCLAPHHRVLTADLRWVSLGDVSVGDRLVGFDEENYAGTGRRYHTAVVESVESATEECYEVLLSDGRVFTTTAEHRWLVGSGGASNGGKSRFSWIRTDRMRDSRTHGQKFSTKVQRLIDTWEDGSGFDDGYLSGLLDGEGCLSGRHSLTFAQNEGLVLDRAVGMLERRGNRHNLRVHTKFKDNSCVNVHITGRLMDRLSFLGSLRPVRLLDKVDPEKFGRLEHRDTDVYSVISVRPVGPKEIAKVQTSTGTMIVDGFPMHNCKQDVVLLDALYHQLRPYMATHPNMANLGGGTCPRCGGMRLQSRGTAKTATGTYKRYQCQDCGAWSRERLQDKDSERPRLVNA